MLRLAALCSSRLLVLVLAGLLIVYRSPAGALEGRGPGAVPQEIGTPHEPPKAPKPPAAKEKPLPGAVVEMRKQSSLPLSRDTSRSYACRSTGTR